MTMPWPLEIARGYSAEQWKALRLEPDAPDTADWQTAIAIVNAGVIFHRRAGEILHQS